MGAVTSTTNSVASYGVYKLPYITSAIQVNTENLQQCLSQIPEENIAGMRNCIQNNVSSTAGNNTMNVNQNVSFFGPGEVVMKKTVTEYGGTNLNTGINPIKSQIVTSNVHQAPAFPVSECYEKFESINDDNNLNIESNKIFCFNGTFTLLTIFVLILLLIFINVNSKSEK
jgi:hypothetical protein